MGIPILDTILDVIKEPLDRLIPDKNAKQQFEHELEMQVLKAGLGQMEINKAEAEHPSVFVAGWRPAVGWVCAAALAWQFIGHDILLWARAAFFPAVPMPPALTGSDTLVTVLMSMLGLGGLRTVEKIKGVSRETWDK
ncbi:3TM-type holin [Kordiimonas marina]|uniref:3TM-type holin n=1 Tax=Kordiimonas marina TaxID=2872312 RepID=UPI001FF4258A|nr:3TM-type holin [Kordiimonas marina]MCJ9428704.1 holin family protein [Kordiimonas marina]